MRTPPRDGLQPPNSMGLLGRSISLRRQPGAALRPPPAEDGLACARAHTLAEPVRLLPLPRIRLVCPLHEASSSVVGMLMARAARGPAPRPSSVPERRPRPRPGRGLRGPSVNTRDDPPARSATTHVHNCGKSCGQQKVPAHCDFSRRNLTLVTRPRANFAAPTSLSSPQAVAPLSGGPGALYDRPPLAPNDQRNHPHRTRQYPALAAAA
jgi:hypothetical protein